MISVQVLNELMNVWCRKQRRTWEEIEDGLDVVKILLDPPQPLSAELHDAAVAIAQKYEFSICDSLIVAAAQRAGCSMLYSENLQHQQTIEQLTIRNPFGKV